MLKEFFISQIRIYGSIAVFIGLLMEYVGLPVPGETLMSFIGFLSWKSTNFSIYSSLISAIAGTFSGSMLAWFIGYRFGENAILKYGKYIHITEDKLSQTKESFNKHKGLLIIFGKYIPGVRHIIPYLSGIAKMEPGTYALYNLMGSIIWCSSFIGLGFILGNKWQAVERIVKAYLLLFVLLLVFIFIVIKYFGKHKKAIFSIAFPAFLFVKLCEDLIKNEFNAFDDTIYNFVSGFISENMTAFMKFMSFMGSSAVLASIALISAAVLWKNRKYSFYGRMIAVNLLASSVLNEVFKLIFHRERPDILRLIEVAGYSFPSGHSMTSLSFYGFIAYLFYIHIKAPWKYPIAAVFSLLILLIGLSRIYLGVHYPSDVLSGFSAGLAWLAIFIAITKIYLYKQGDITVS